LRENWDKIKMDEIDLRILEALVDDGRITFKELAKKFGIDERMVSRRVERLVKEGVISRFTVDIDWSKLGFEMQAYVSTRTAVGEDLKNRLFEFFDTDPRIIRVDSTVGAYEYVLYAICRDLQDFRSKIGTPLEPLTAGLSTSIVSHHIKPLDYKPLLRMAAQIAGTIKRSNLPDSVGEGEGDTGAT